jgi:hypothetical protein
MEQTRETISQSLAECLCWQAAHRDGSRVARRLSGWTKGPCWITSSTSCTNPRWSTCWVMSRAPGTRGPICPDALADNIVKLNVRDLTALSGPWPMPGCWPRR